MSLVMTYSAGRFLLEGQATFETLDALSRELLTQSAKAGDLVLDLARLDDCDSVFIATLTACLQSKSGHKGAIVLENVPGRVSSMLSVYGLDDCGLVIGSMQ